MIETSGAIRTLVFDCDGVILNSNTVKTEAFRHTTSAYGPAAAQAMVDYHLARGGVSRYKKFRHFLSEIVPKKATSIKGPNFEDLLCAYAKDVESGLTTCEIAPGLADLRAATADIPWMIVSGGAQDELREIFTRRGINELFDGGIFGSPDSKNEILTREIAAGNLRTPAVFVGDSRYDHEAAKSAGLDFVFLNRWTEFREWQAYTMHHEITVIDELNQLGDFPFSSPFKEK